MWWRIRILNPENPEEELSEPFEHEGINQDLVDLINEFLESRGFNESISISNLRCLTSRAQRIAQPGSRNPTGRPNIERIAKWLILEKAYKVKIEKKGKVEIKTFYHLPELLKTS